MHERMRATGNRHPHGCWSSARALLHPSRRRRVLPLCSLADAGAPCVHPAPLFTPGCQAEFHRMLRITELSRTVSKENIAKSSKSGGWMGGGRRRSDAAAGGALHAHRRARCMQQPRSLTEEAFFGPAHSTPYCCRQHPACALTCRPSPCTLSHAAPPSTLLLPLPLLQ